MATVPATQGNAQRPSGLMQNDMLDGLSNLGVFRQIGLLIGLAASVLANNLHTVALVTRPRLLEVRLKQLQLVELLENRALLVAVTTRLLYTTDGAGEGASVERGGRPMINKKTA